MNLIKKMTADESVAFVKEAISYALENMHLDLDYEKYVSKKFINTIDDKKFNFEEWVAHLKNIKTMVKSMQPIFEYAIADGDRVAIGFIVKSITNDGQEILVKDMAMFIIEDYKIVYCDELTRLVTGDSAYKNFASTS